MLNKLFLLTLAASLVFTSSAQAITLEEKQLINGGIYWYSPSGTQTCNINASQGALLEPHVTEALEPNIAIYQKVGEAEDIPWQMLAAIHYRETTGGRTNPGNGDGLYQILTADYPASQSVDDQEFEQQTTEAARFIKSKISSIHPDNRTTLTASSWNDDMVKDLFFSYNGRASFYKDQAVNLGLIPEDERDSRGFEGSPYVMNLYDSIRDSSLNSDWQQFLNDNGRTGPANQQPGAWLIFESLAGLRCTSSSELASQVVSIAVREYELGVVEDPPGSNSGGRIDLYTDGNPEAWCANFVSWVFNEAGAPFTGGLSGGWRIPGAKNVGAWHEANATWIDKDALLSGAEKAQPGDVYVIDRDDPNNPNAGHVGIVIEVSADGQTLTTIDGNLSNQILKREYSITNPKFIGIGRR